ncbi:hypothetical protein BYT27DRAFT_7098221 [Phlegmacium glaucopus]|nr:hypothetical protein BYT27DRAFT_7098221 [Phlegmacium glaucopus]
MSSKADSNVDSNVDSSPNASGLKPEQSQSLKEREMKPQEEPVIRSIKEMYSCKPTDDTFAVYVREAVFHDPVGIAKGQDSIQSQFVGLAKLFPRADITKFRILQNPSTVPENAVLIDQDVAYFRDTSGSPIKVLNSLLTLKLNDENKVVSHNEEWDHQKTTTAEDGFLGMLNEERKKITAALTDALAGSKDKNNSGEKN